jgi:TRAP-type C4-dicarboxylate transport system substrate-binding protein
MVTGLCTFLVLSFVGLSLATAAQPITIKAVSAWPKTVWETQNFMRLLEIINQNLAKKFPGQVEMKYLGGPEIIPHAEQVEALRRGLVDMVFSATGYYTSVAPVAEGLNLTYLPPAQERAKGIYSFYDQVHQKKVNAHFLGKLGTFLPFVIYLKKPVNKADLTGLKIRTSGTHVPFIRNIGGLPVMTPPTDIYTSLERGVLDGLIWPAGLIKEWGWPEVIKYVLDEQFYSTVCVVLVNLDTWKKLPKGVQETITASEIQAEQETEARAKKRWDDEWAWFKEKGIQFIKLPEVEAKKFRNVADASLWEVLAQKDPENTATLKKLLAK